MNRTRMIFCMFILALVTACNDNGQTIDELDEDNEDEEIDEEEKEMKEKRNEEEIDEGKTDHEEIDEQNETEEVADQFDPMYELAEDHTVQPIDDANEKVVLLTIDDAPDSYSAEMANILADLDAGAIFFVNGHFLQSEEGKAQLQEIYELGFEIGNHTMTHANLSDLTEEEQIDEIVELNDLVEEIIGERPRFFRAPFGVNTDVSKRIVEEENMQWMNWTYGYDFVEGYMETDALTEIMVEAPELRSGANLLMHDREFTKEALADIVEGLREKDYEIVDPSLIK
ncbi:polysaccharide deacetylase family protein [Evansella halocellulosilytica]|uniref:polysaccharide deacetylase family protein n=1 Tax=Evansella halocellulosilytica TaxID=2011013 RepID=UPI00387EAD98